MQRLILHRYFIFLSTLALWLGSCQKDRFIISKDATLIVGVDTLKFDTVFTTLGSVTRRFTIVNNNAQKLRIDQISLGGGSASAFELNINGLAVPTANNLELAANDSLYVFVRVTIDPNVQNQAFVVQDSIGIAYNGNLRQVQLQAFGQNARFIQGGTISTNTTWDASLPYVILQPLTIMAGATLTIERGTRIFCNANAPLIVNGSLQCLGGAALQDRIVFRGDRLDAEFRDFPGGWPGIIFNGTSTNNRLVYTNILNAFQAIVVGGLPNAVPAKLVMEQCIIDNAFDAGIFALNTSIIAQNCRITQCGNDGQPGEGGSNLIVSGGGQYLFEHCTIATVANFFQNHRQPVVVVGNSLQGAAAPLSVRFINSIIHGEGGQPENELLVTRTAGADFNVVLQNTLYKSKDEVANIVAQNELRNLAPQFDSINTSLRQYNFRLRGSSPAIDAGAATSLTTDLDGLPRPTGQRPDMGSYERQ